MARKFRKIAVLMALAGGLMAAGNAAAFSLLNPAYHGPVKFKYSNFEQETPGTGNGNGIIDAAGEHLDGIAKVTTINADNAANTLLWFDGKDGEELTVRFSNYVAAAITPTVGGLAIDFTGGALQMYLDNTPDFNATHPGTGVTDGTLFLDFIGASGIVPSNTAITLRSTVDVVTTPFTGKGAGFLEIVGGSAAAMFGGAGEIMFLNSDVFGPGPFGWPVGSEDPLRGNIVPEPGTFVLLGLGLAGLGFFGRKRMAKQP